MEANKFTITPIAGGSEREGENERVEEQRQTGSGDLPTQRFLSFLQALTDKEQIGRAHV